jgi:hypothetical protein
LLLFGVVERKAGSHSVPTSALAPRHLDPEGYAPAHAVAHDGVVLTNDLAKAYLAYCKKPEAEGGKGNGVRWVNEKKRCLAWWMEQLGARDLRRVSRDMLSASLEPPGRDGSPSRVPGYPHKVEVI